MKIGQKFNTFTFKEYFFYMDNYEKYTDFNTLGLYRSIIENKKLSLSEKIEVAEYAHKTFLKAFEFLQLQDPNTYFKITTLGQELTQADETQIWKNIRTNQQKILKDKKIKHRNFGDYSKHNCGIESCNFNGLMIKQGSFFAEGKMCFDSDRRKYSIRIDSHLSIKSGKRKTDRKQAKQIIQKILEQDN